MNFKSAIKNFLISTILVGIAALLTSQLEFIWSGIPFSLFFAAIAASAWICDSICGWWAIALSLLLTDLILLEHRGSALLSGEQLLQLMLLGVIAGIINLLISTVRKSESQMEAERETLRVTLLSIGDAVIACGPKGHVTFMNTGAEALTGWKSSEAVGKPLTEVFNIINEVTRKPVENPVQKVLQSGQIVGLANHTAVISRNNVETPIEDSAAPIRTHTGEVLGVIMVFHDVAEKRKAELALKQSHADLEVRVAERTEELRSNQERLQRLVEGAPDYALYMLDENGVVVTWNSGAQRIKGYSASEIIGRSFTTFFTPEDVAAGRPSSLMQRALAEGRAEDEGWRVRKDGTRFWANAIITPYRDESGSVRGFVKVTRDLTERRNTEEAQRKLYQAQIAKEQAQRAEQRIVAVLNTITDAYIAVDKHWVITFANPEAERQSGFTRERLVGSNYWELFSRLRGTDVERQMTQALEQQALVEFDYFFEPASKWFATKAYPIPDGLAAFTRDITPQKHAEAALRAETERFRVTLHSIGDAVIVTDTAARVTMLNPVAETLTGWTQPEALGRPLDEIFNILNEYTRAHAENPARRALREGTIVGLANHTLLISRNGAETPIDDSAAPIKDEQGHVLGVVLVFRDIIEKKKAETERANLLKREQEARKSAEHANRLKDEFLAIVSHELRTPLTPIMGWTRMLRSRDVGSEEMSRGLEVIDRNVTMQAKVIEDLLDVSRIITGKLHLNFKPIELTSVVAAAIDTIQPSASARHITLLSDLEPGAGIMYGDPARLQQATWNLLGNAVKFTPKGGTVRVTLSIVDSQAELVIADTGEGIEPAFLPALFDRFSQGDSSTTRVHGGLGLGLAIVKHVVEAHGGSVSAESAGKGKGSAFKVRLPISPVHPRADFPLPPRLIGDVPSIKDLSVLVVEDQSDARELITEALRGAGATVVAAESVADALSKFEDGKFDVLVSDIGMPGDDGYALIRRIRERSATNGGLIPAIALTAFAKPEDRAAALSAGFQVHLAKPVDPLELIKSVATAVEKS